MGTRSSTRFGQLKSVVAKNAASSFVSMLWLNGLSLLAIPVYIKLLGTGSWGIVAACSSLQLLFTFIDMGFSQIVPRWVAREAQEPALLRQYIRAFHKIYGGLALAGFVAIQTCADPLANHWFNVSAPQAAELELCIRLVAFQLLFQFANNLYVGIWHGLQLQVQANARSCVFGTLKHGLAMGTLLWVGPNPAYYAAAFGLASLAELVASVAATQRHGLLAAAPAGQHLDMKPFLREAGVLSFGIMIGLAVSQMDRVVLSRLVPVDSFGVYVVVANLALAFLALQAPLTRAYFPVLVQDVKTEGHVNRATLRRLILGNTLICVLPALVMCAVADWVLRVWVHNEHFVEQGTMPLRLLLVAMCLNALYNCFYQVIVAHGKAHVVVKLNLACLIVGVLAVAALYGRASLSLGGVIWVATTLTQLVLGATWYWHTSKTTSTSEPAAADTR